MESDENTSSSEQICNNIEQAYIEAANEVHGEEKTLDAWNVMETYRWGSLYAQKSERNKIREKESSYKRTVQANEREAKMQTRQDKRQSINSILDEAENAANRQNMTTIYNIPKMLSNEKLKQSVGNFDEKRRLSSTEQQQRWN